MRLYLDDARPTPAGFDERAFTANYAIELLKSGRITFISLDHDLAALHLIDPDLPGTGYDVACFIERAVFEGTIAMPVWACHSSNPAGRQRIEAAMRSAERFAAERARSVLGAPPGREENP